ncbi:hypothetical protein AAFC00_003103 [Neodothiora populina]|uniref:N-acetyltransferase domain-containing protein n=1 Tax=Neodothiora populina TaxID=2781224 RepID=A0ABR3PA08_9PEZI
MSTSSTPKKPLPHQTSPMPHPFRSARLTYTTPDWTTTLSPHTSPASADDAFFHALNSNYTGLANAYPGLLKPVGTKDVSELKKFLEGCLLSVLMCIGRATGAVDTDGQDETELVRIGELHLSGPPPHAAHHRRAMDSINMLPEWQGQGYGSEAIEWVLEWGFLRAGLHRIGIGAFEWNPRAVALYQRLGFVLEGRSREAFFFEGEWYDGIELAMLDREWRAIKEKKMKKKDEEEHPFAF